MIFVLLISCRQIKICMLQILGICIQDKILINAQAC